MHKHLDAAHASLASALRRHHVTTILSQLVEEVVSKQSSATCASLEAQCQEHEAALRKRREQWNGISAALDTQILSLRAQEKEQATRIDATNCALEDATRETGALRVQERLLLQRKELLSAKQDISLLSNVVVRNLALCLDAADLAAAVCVSRRWALVLNRGYVWKSVLQLRLVKHQRARRRYKAQLIPLQRKVMITVPLGKKEHHLEKDEIFERAMNKVADHISNAKSIREDQAQKKGVEEEVIAFLGANLDAQQHELGLLRVERSEWNRNIEEIHRRKAALAHAMKHHDASLCALKAKLAALQEGHAHFMQESTAKQAILQELHYSHSVERTDISSSNDVVKELKKQKKVLVKGVKNLRAELDKAVAVRDTYQIKLTKLQQQQQQQQQQ